jgi:hypothetical protein
MGPCSKCLLDLCCCFTSAPYFPNHIVPQWPTSTWWWGGVFVSTSSTTNGMVFWGYAFPLVGHFATNGVVRTIFLLCRVTISLRCHSKEESDTSWYSCCFASWGNAIIFCYTLVGRCGNYSHQGLRMVMLSLLFCHESWVSGDWSRLL